jgi:hypothetical protein
MSVNHSLGAFARDAANTAENVLNLTSLVAAHRLANAPSDSCRLFAMFARMRACRLNC